MALNLEVFWRKPYRLVDASTDGLIYSCPEIDRIPNSAGVYYFARQFGAGLIPLYVGQAIDLRKRLWQHFEANVRLMRSIQEAKNGTRVVVVGQWTPQPGQQRKRALNLIESALIKSALAEGYDLFNYNGTRTPTHTIKLYGNRPAWRSVFRGTTVHLAST